MVKLLNNTVSIPLPVAMGVGNPIFWHCTAELSKSSLDTLVYCIDTLQVQRLALRSCLSCVMLLSRSHTPYHWGG